MNKALTAILTLAIAVIAGYLVVQMLPASLFLSSIDRPSTQTPTATRTPRPPNTPRPTPTPTLEPAYLTTTRLTNIRGCPGTNYLIIGMAPANEKFLITGKNAPPGDWWQIEIAKGRPGWMYGPLVDATNPGNVKVAKCIPTPTPTPTPGECL